MDFGATMTLLSLSATERSLTRTRHPDPNNGVWPARDREQTFDQLELLLHSQPGEFSARQAAGGKPVSRRKARVNEVSDS